MVATGHNQVNIPGSPITSARERRRQALELKKAGLNYQQIADAVGYGSANSAAQAVRKSLKQYTLENVQDLRKVQYAQLQTLLTGLWPKAVAGDMGAVDRILKIQERQAAIFGSDAPKQASTEVSIKHRGLLIIEGDNEDAYVQAVQQVKRELPQAQVIDVEDAS